MTATKATLHMVFARDEGCCARCGKPITGERGRDWSVHHRTPRARGGTKRPWIDAPANLIMLDGSGTTGCHGWVESHRDHALADGLLLRSNGRALATEIPIRHAIHGLVLLTDDGGFEPVIEMLAAELWHAFGHTKGGT